MRAANHPTVHRTASCSKEFSGKNVSNAEVEELLVTVELTACHEMDGRVSQFLCSNKFHALIPELLGEGTWQKLLLFF